MYMWVLIIKVYVAVFPIFLVAQTTYNVSLILQTWPKLSQLSDPFDTTQGGTHKL